MRSVLMIVFAWALAFGGSTNPASAQVESRRADEAGFLGGEGSANYRLAARFAPYNIQDMIHSTTEAPRWIEGTEKFWYE